MKTSYPFVAGRRAIVLIELNLLIIIFDIGLSIIKKIYLSKRERLIDLST